MKSQSVLLYVLAGSFLGACATQNPPTAVQMQLNPSLAGASVQADVVGVSKDKQAELDATSVTSYWHDASIRQKFAPVPFRFGPGKPLIQTFGEKDPAWQRWKNPSEVVVFLDLPGMPNDESRKKTIELDGKPKTLQIGPNGFVGP